MGQEDNRTRLGDGTSCVRLEKKNVIVIRRQDWKRDWTGTPRYSMVGVGTDHSSSQVNNDPRAGWRLGCFRCLWSPGHRGCGFETAPNSDPLGARGLTACCPLVNPGVYEFTLCFEC